MCRALVTKSLAFFQTGTQKNPTPLLNHTSPQGITPVRIMHEAYDMAQNNPDLNIYLEVMFTGPILGSDLTGFLMTL